MNAFVTTREAVLTDEAWLSDAFRENYAMLLSIGRVFVGGSQEKMDMIDDEIQEVFAILWRKRERLRSHPNIDAWLVEALRRQLRGHLSRAARRQRRAAMSSLDGMEDGQAERIEQTVYPDPAEVLDGKEQYQLLVSLLGQEGAEMFWAYCVQGQSARALAARYGCSEACVWTRVSRCKKKVLARADLFFLLMLAFVLGV